MGAFFIQPPAFAAYFSNAWLNCLCTEQHMILALLGKTLEGRLNTTHCNASRNAILGCAHLFQCLQRQPAPFVMHSLVADAHYQAGQASHYLRCRKESCAQARKCDEFVLYDCLKSTLRAVNDSLPRANHNEGATRLPPVPRIWGPGMVAGLSLSSQRGDRGSK